jgi:feruloyl-CoA synthase
VLVDWLPWNHTFGGNHNFGLTVYNGGTLYIDDGKPTPALMAETLRNLREIAPTVYFNVPTGFEAIANAMKTDDALRKNLLSRVRCSSTPARRWPSPCGTRCTRCRSARSANAS